MRVWRFGIGCVWLLGLAACAPPGNPISITSIAERRVDIMSAGTPVVIVPPEGYCVVRDSLRSGEQSVFALMAGCEADEAAVNPGLVTVTVSLAPLFAPGENRLMAIDRLEAFLGSAQGLSLAGRGGPTEKLKILETYREPDSLVLLVQDDGEQVIARSSPRFWRAFLELRGRMVSLSVSSFREQPVDDRQMLAVIRRAVTALRDANPALGTEPVATESVPLPAAPPASAG